MKIITYKESIEKINKKVSDVTLTKWEIFNSMVEKYKNIKKPLIFDTDEEFRIFYNSLEEFKRFLINKFAYTFDKTIDDEFKKKAGLFESSLKYRIGTYIVITSEVKKIKIGTLARIKQVKITSKKNVPKGYRTEVDIITKDGKKCTLNSGYFDVVNFELSEIPEDYILIS